MFREFEGRILVGGVIIAVLFIGGIFIYSKWSYTRFADEIGEPPLPQTKTADKIHPITTEVKKQSEIINVDSENSKQSINETNENIPTKGQVSKENTNTSIVTTEFDPTQLLSTFGMPEEITSLLDQNAEEGEFEKAEEHIKEKFGQSPAVDAIIDQLKNLSGRPVQLNELTELFETWIQVLPEEEQKTRRQLKNS